MNIWSFKEKRSGKQSAGMEGALYQVVEQRLRRWQNKSERGTLWKRFTSLRITVKMKIMR